jgi:hypothetical protein
LDAQSETKRDGLQSPDWKTRNELLEALATRCGRTVAVADTAHYERFRRQTLYRKKGEHAFSLDFRTPSLQERDLGRSAPH